MVARLGARLGAAACVQRAQGAAGGAAAWGPPVVSGVRGGMGVGEGVGGARWRYALLAGTACAAAAATANVHAAECKAMPPATLDCELPTGKLSCAKRPEGFGRWFWWGRKPHRPVVLVSCGCFNPPTTMHLRLFEIAADDLKRRGFDVLGGYMSPVHDDYVSKKPALALASAEERARMCELAADSSPNLMVDRWESTRGEYQRTLNVLRHIERELNAGRGTEEEPIRVVLVCGADLLKSFMTPGVWIPEHLREIAGDKHGVACVVRPGTEIEQHLSESPVLGPLRDHVWVVRDDVTNDTSSTKVRSKVKEGRSIRYLVPEPVASYIRDRGLYRS